MEQITSVELMETATQKIIGTDISADEYMAVYAGKHYEWVDGIVYAMSPIHDRHYQVEKYLNRLIDAYFEIKPIGLIKEDPFVMRFKFRDKSGIEKEARRQPDIQVILETNPNQPTPTCMDGVADIVIEIISPGTESVDRGTKFAEYQSGGVYEYWIINPINHEVLFYRLNDESIYVPQYADSEENYRTPQLPGLIVHVPILWIRPIPGMSQIVKQVEAMLA